MNADNKVKFGAARCCEELTTALLVHMSVPTVTEAVAGAIRSISVNDDNEVKFGAARCCEELTTALRVHMSVPTVTQKVANAMMNICVNNAAHKAKFKSLGVAALVDSALSLHQSNASLQADLRDLKSRFA